MNNELNNLESILDNLNVTKEKTPFKINQLKIEHFYWCADEIEPGMPKRTSVELICNYNFVKEELEWKKIVSHTYVSLQNCEECITTSHTEDVKNGTEIIKKIEYFDLRELKNNYFTDEAPEKFTHWELTYNNYFKITGTYDQEITEFSKISEFLELKKVIDEEAKKVKEKLENK